MKKFIILAILTIVSACTHIPSDINGDQVFFAFDSAKISDDARDNLESQALYMKKNPDINVTIQGRCDERGSTEYNLALGALRAGNAAHVLIREGIEPQRIKTISYGKENPLYKGTGEKVWAKNRNATTVVK
ncbi:MAG: OmpA family protein [Alphaproteobacteria bacterium]|jgi:peptidoglycan-associated lipoprotein|nr:OmpA family protein [Alphaproteobacteria bacterium]MDW2995543.1 OmpA family protein [Alphaproteobacteria bacterium]